MKVWELSGDPTRARFVGLVACCVLAVYLVPSSAQIERFSPAYFALVVPPWLYVIVNWRFLLSGYGPTSALMAVFGILAGISGILRGDLPLAYNAAFLAAVAVVIVNSKAYLTLTELNWVFAACVVGSVVIYVFDATAYGFLPGQAIAPSCHASLSWRISLFRVTAESAMLSLVVLMANLAYGGRLRPWVRGLVTSMALYFLLFSGIRSVVAAAAIVVPICTWICLKAETWEGRRRATVGLFVGVAVAMWVPYWVDQRPVDFWENYALRNQSCTYITTYFGPTGVPQDAGTVSERNGNPVDARQDVPPDWYGRTVNRHCAARYQLALFVDHPLGTRDVRPTSDRELTDLGCRPGTLGYYCASCTFATYWLARAGIFATPLVAAFLVMFVGALRRSQAVLALFLAAFGMASVGWGVMYVPYNIIFVLMMAMPAIIAYESGRKAT